MFDHKGHQGRTTQSHVPPAWFALVEIVARIHREPYHWPIGRTAFPNIAYFATELGLPTGLRHERGSYGPFAADLKPLLTRLFNHGLLREQKVGKMFSLEPGPTYADASEILASEMERWEPIIGRVADPFLRMRTQDAEIAAAVYFSARKLVSEGAAKPTEGDVLAEVKRWKLKRRPPLGDEEIARSIRALNLLRWLDLTLTPDLPLPQESLAEA